MEPSYKWWHISSFNTILYPKGSITPYLMLNPFPNYPFLNSTLQSLVFTFKISIVEQFLLLFKNRRLLIDSKAILILEYKWILVLERSSMIDPRKLLTTLMEVDGFVWDPRLDGERIEIFLIRVEKLQPSRRILKPCGWRRYVMSQSE